MVYDKKYRQRVLEYKESGHTFKEVKEAFGADHKTYYQWKKQITENGDFVYRYPKEHAGKDEQGPWSPIVEAVIA